jgi:hypothetical protein
LRLLLKLAGTLLVLRWAAGEAAAYAGRHWRPHGPAPVDLPRPPGWMPGPDFESSNDRGIKPR